MSPLLLLFKKLHRTSKVKWEKMWSAQSHVLTQIHSKLELVIHTEFTLRWKPGISCNPIPTSRLRHTLSTKEKKKRIIGELQWGGQLVRPVAYDSSVARLSKITASSRGITQELWRNRCNNTVLQHYDLMRKNTAYEKRCFTPHWQKKNLLIMEAYGSWAYVNFFVNCLNVVFM